MWLWSKSVSVIIFKLYEFLPYYKQQKDISFMWEFILKKTKIKWECGHLKDNLKIIRVGVCKHQQHFSLTMGEMWYVT